MSEDAASKPRGRGLLLSPKTVARLTGLAYLAMVPGGVGFMTIRPRLLSSTAQGTLSNLSQHTELARLGVAAMLSVVVAQALAALGFYALYRTARPTVAFGVAGFGLMNSAAILAGAVASSSAVGLAGGASSEDPATAAVVHALYVFEGNAWSVGGLFFGLWLIPMGLGAATTELFHGGRLLGGLLVLGGVAYVASAFLALSPAMVTAGVPDMLAGVATLGEVWTMLALLVVGVRAKSPARPEPPATRA